MLLASLPSGYCLPHSVASSAGEPVTLAGAVENVRVICQKFYERDGMDVRKLEEGLGGVGANFKEITDIRMMCEIYAKGRMDEQRSRLGLKSPAD
jgi:hypothetical protein